MRNANRKERMQESIKRIRSGFLQGGREKLFNVLPAQELARAVQEAVGVWRDRLYAPLVALRWFVEQVLHTDHACQDVVVRYAGQAGGAGRGTGEPVERAVLQSLSEVAVGAGGATGQDGGRAA